MPNTVKSQAPTSPRPITIPKPPLQALAALVHDAVGKCALTEILQATGITFFLSRVS